MDEERLQTTENLDETAINIDSAPLLLMFAEYDFHDGDSHCRRLKPRDLSFMVDYLQLIVRKKEIGHVSARFQDFS